MECFLGLEAVYFNVKLEISSVPAVSPVLHKNVWKIGV